MKDNLKKKIKFISLLVVLFVPVSNCLAAIMTCPKEFKGQSGHIYKQDPRNTYISIDTRPPRLAVCVYEQACLLLARNATPANPNEWNTKEERGGDDTPYKMYYCKNPSDPNTCSFNADGEFVINAPQSACK